jgi:hypothetical protein
MQSLAPVKQQQAIEEHWKAREAELAHLPGFKREMIIKKEKQEVKAGVRKLPPHVLQAGVADIPSKPTPQQRFATARQPTPVASAATSLPPPPPVATTTSKSSGAGHGVFLPPPPPV